MKKKNWILLIPVLILIVVGSLLVKFAPVAYESLKKPAFAPKGFVFGIAWTIFYAILYFTGTKAIKSIDFKNRTFQLYNLIFIFQFLWILFFFTLGYRLIALFTLAIIYLLSVAYVFMISKENKKYGYFNLPYILWLLFAFLLNLSILVLN